MLFGDPAVRPAGLERALVRAGYEVAELEAFGPLAAEGAPPPDCLVATVSSAEALEPLLEARDATWQTVPVVTILASGRGGGVASALRAGAADVMVIPVDLGEFCARLEARLRGRGQAAARHQADQVHDLMFEIFQELSSALRPDEVVQTLVRRVGEALGVAQCTFIRLDADDRGGRVIASFDQPTQRDVRIDLARYPELREALARGEPLFVPDIQRDPLFEAERQRWADERLAVDVRSVLAVPVVLHGRQSGVFLIRTRRAEPQLSAEQVEFAVRLVQAAARVLESEERRSTIYRRQGTAATLDPLTGTGSLDALDRRLRDEFERSRRYALSFSLVLLDVDELRAINALAGTEGGDRVLVELASLLQRELRAPDFISRYGGDEFALVLPETDLEGARRSVTRVRASIEGHGFPDLPADHHPRLSAGIVTFPHPAATQAEDLLALVEAALLRGKAQTEERIGTAESVAA